MITVRLTPTERAYCDRIARERNATQQGHGAVDLGFDDRLTAAEKHLQGLPGEYAIRALLGLPPPTVYSHADDGTDATLAGKTIQIKTRRDLGRDLLVPVGPPYRPEPVTDWLALCEMNGLHATEIGIVGWVHIDAWRFSPERKLLQLRVPTWMWPRALLDPETPACFGARIKTPTSP